MKVVLKILWVAAMVLFASSAFSQIPPPAPPSVATPIDGFSMYLVVIGSAYGYSRLRKSEGIDD